MRFHVDNHTQVVASIRNRFKDEKSIKNEIEEPKNHKIEGYRTSHNYKIRWNWEKSFCIFTCHIMSSYYS